MNDLVRFSAVLLFGTLTLVAFFLVLGALFPERIARTGRLAGQSPGRSLALGLLNAVFLASLVVALLAVSEWTRLRVLGFPALLLVVLAAVAASFGLAGVTQLVGERLLPDRGPALRQAAGALAAGLACALPFAGWFLLLPYLLLVGLGAFILSFFDLGPRPRLD
jgi:hypothetical protein